MLRIGSPWYLLLLLPLAAAAWCMYRRRVRSGIVFPATARVPAGGATWRAAAAALLPAVALAGLALAVVALARPQTVFSRSRRTADVIAVQMVVDVSGSMEALDLSERTAAGLRVRTRLDVVKEVFARFVDKRPDDLIGLVTFGGYASTRAPLTADHDALRHVLQGVEIPRQGTGADGQPQDREELLTAIGDALATGCARLQGAETKSRIIVLLSDGESNTGAVKPDEMIPAARKMGVKVYAIGVGTTGPAPFRARDLFGRETIVQAEVALDEALLRRVSEGTGGRYFNVRDPKGLERALEDIDHLEKTRVEQEVYSQYHELFPWFLLPGLGLFFAGTALNLLLARRVL